MGNTWVIPVLASILILSVFAATDVFATVIINEDTKITASDAVDFGRFGWSVSSEGDRIVVGDAFNVHSGLSFAGAVYVYDLVGGIWVETKIIPSTVESESFGREVSMDGDRIIVGVPRGSFLSVFTGVIYVFDFDGTDWVETARFTTSDAISNSQIGNAISVSGDRIVVGNWRDTENGLQAGAIYVFDFDGTDWVETKITPSDFGTSIDRFGREVSIDGDRIVVGATAASRSGFDRSGAAYVYDFDGIDWVETRIEASDIGDTQFYGWSVSIHGDRIVVASLLSGGAAYVYDFDGTDWIETAKLVSGDATPSQRYGESVSVHGDRIAVGDYLNDGLGDNAGSAYAYELVAGSWIETILLASDGGGSDQFGESVSVSEDRVVVGSPRDDFSTTFLQQGSIYLFEHDSDEDGITNGLDNCPKIPNVGQEDTDGNGVGDACNDADDADGDEYSNTLDNCPGVSNPGQEDTDGNGVGNACNDADDIDGDEYSNALDNCPGISNPDQTDSNGNGVGDACEGTGGSSEITCGEGTTLNVDVCEADVTQSQLDSAEAETQSLFDILLSGEITICHNDKTKTISLAAFGTHFLHGDTIGECP